MNFSMTANVKCAIAQTSSLENSRCLSADSDSLYLQFKPTIWAQSYARKHTALSRFRNVTFRYHYVMQKNSRCIETEQRCLTRVLHFNRQI